MTNATAIRIRTAVTRSHTAELPDGTTIDLPHEGCDHIDPVLTDDGNTFRYASLDEYPSEYDWQEGVEFVQGSWRNLHYCDDVEAWIEDVSPDHDIFAVDVYEHGQIMYSLSGNGPQCDFDTARGGAAIAIPNDKHESPFTNTEEAAAAILSEYTSWCNGDVYFMTEMTRDPETGEWSEGDTIGGFIGWEHVEDCLKNGY